MTHWMHPPKLGRPYERNLFDPIVEGHRYHLSAELLQKLWDRARAEAIDYAASPDHGQAQRRFHELAGRAARRGGRLLPDVGKLTQVDIETNEISKDMWNVSDSTLRTPGRETLVTADARRTQSRSEVIQRSNQMGARSGGAPRAMARLDGKTQPGAEEELEKLSDQGGIPLAPELRTRVEMLFGHRFSHVRIHADHAATRATQVAGARAVTLGSNIFFNHGQFDPSTESGNRLLLHELTHVVQHDQGRLRPPASGRIELSTPSDSTELEARAMEDRAGELQVSAQLLNPIIEETTAKVPLNSSEASSLGRRAAAAPDKQPKTFIPPDVPDFAGKDAFSKIISWQDRTVEVHYFPGKIGTRTLLILGGVHQSERKAVALSQELLDQLESFKIVPDDNVVFIPNLFEDRHTTDRDIDSQLTNRNSPAANESLEAAVKRGHGVPRDSEGRKMLPENVILFAIAEKAKATDSLSIHGHRRMEDKSKIPTDGAASITVDLTKSRSVEGEFVTSQMLQAAKAKGLPVPGNLTDANGNMSTAYPTDSAPHTTPGTTFGQWGIAAGGMNQILIEVEGNDWEATTKQKAEIQGYVDVIRDKFLTDRGKLALELLSGWIMAQLPSIVEFLKKLTP